MEKRASWVRILILVLMASFTLSLHYMLFPMPHWLHLLHRRLCYVPILLGGLWFGLAGGSGVALVISSATLPLALMNHGPLWTNEDLIEITFYLGLGILTGVLVDKRERERSNAERLQQQLERSERQAALGRLASGVAHEVRTPLGSIQGAAEILAEDFPEGHPKKAFLDILLAEVDRLKAVVQEFLDLGRPITVEPEELGAKNIAEACRNSLLAFAEGTGVRVHLRVPANCRVWADPFRLHQALTNLLRNAIQASARGGRVHISAWMAGEGCLFAVEDEGSGLPLGEEGRLFEPFFTKRKDGTGLGLALTRQIAEAHGGWVKGENRPEGGARFSLWLPGRGPEPVEAGGGVVLNNRTEGS
ncbi:MAG: ATP-binding protein [Acidobacteriota bacterium]